MGVLIPAENVKSVAELSVERINKKWEKIQVLKNKKMLASYPFEHSEETLNSAIPPSQSNKYLWGELTWEEAELL